MVRIQGSCGSGATCVHCTVQNPGMARLINVDRKRTAPVVALGLAIAFVLLCGTVVLGSFSSDGKTTLRLGGTVDRILVGGDGHLLLVANNFRGHGRGIVGLRPNGTVDPKFGHHGFAAANWKDAVVQKDGRIVGVEPGGTTVSVRRLRPNGLPDPSFGQGGSVSVNFGGSIEEGRAVAIAPEGKILIGGSTATYEAPRGGSDRVGVVARLNSNGSLDSSFSRDGLVSFDGTSSVAALAYDHRGGVLVATGSETGPAGNEVHRLNRGGAPDRSFGREGRLSIRVGNPGSPYRYFAPIPHIGVLADGRFVLVGTTTDEGTGKDNSHGLAVRYLPDGRLDAFYGAAGYAHFGFRGAQFTFPQAFVVGRRHGRLVIAAGLIDPATEGHRFGAISLGSDGRPYRRFGRAGQAWTRFPGNSWVQDIATQARRRVVLVGWLQSGRGNATALARLSLNN